MMPLNITVISAKDLENVRTFSQSRIYVEVSVQGDPGSMQKTFVDTNGETDPKWNQRLVVPYLTTPGDSLLFQLKAERSLMDDKLVGSVTVPVRELLRSNINISSSSTERVVEYQVITTSGEPKGSLKFSFHFQGNFNQEQLDEAARAPNNPAVSSSSSPPQRPPQDTPMGMGGAYKIAGGFGAMVLSAALGSAFDVGFDELFQGNRDNVS